jgi:hypothetical protein
MIEMLVSDAKELELRQLDGVRSIGAWVMVTAPRSDLFELLADPSKHALFDGSGTVKGSLQAPKRLYLNATFSMNMRLLVPYRITNEVVEFVEGYSIAWRHMGRHVWRYLLEDVEDGSTKVTEIFYWGEARSPLLYESLKIPKRNGESIVATLKRMRDLYN